MANDDFTKGECRHCAGHLEFPAAAAGQSIACPHCGQPTELRPRPSSTNSTGIRRLWLVAAPAVLLFLAGAASWLYFQEKTPPPGVTESQPAAPIPAAPSVTTSPAKPSAPVLAPGEVRTNDFDISPIQLEKTPGSSLVYVTGKIRNLTARQRFGVKVEFTLLDTADQAIGHATDYQSVLDPNGDWDFKALVMESKTVSARFSGIKEDQ